MSQVGCPKCYALQARRIKQTGLIQKLFLQKLGYYPWECRFCKATFILRNRGHRKGEGFRDRDDSSFYDAHGNQGMAGD